MWLSRMSAAQLSNCCSINITSCTLLVRTARRRTSNAVGGEPARESSKAIVRSRSEND